MDKSPPKSETNKIIKNHTHDLWKKRYNKSIKSSTMEYLVPEIDTALSGQLMKMSRADLSIAIQYLTGHNFLLHHEKKMTTGEDRRKFLNSRCRLCNREEETTQHMIYNCDALAKKRAATLGAYFLDPKTDCLEIQDVIEFLKAADLTNHPIPEGHLTDLNPPLI